MIEGFILNVLIAVVICCSGSVQYGGAFETPLDADTGISQSYR
jgi:hypothetical protein